MYSTPPTITPRAIAPPAAVATSGSRRPPDFTRSGWEDDVASTAASLIDAMLAPAMTLMRRLPIAAKLALPAVIASAPMAALTLRALGWTQGPGTAALQGWFAITGLVMAYLLLAFYRSFRRDVTRVVDALEQLIAGDLRVLQPPPGRDELSRVLGVSNRLGEELARLVTNIRDHAEQTGRDAENLALADRALATRTSWQSTHVRDTIDQTRRLAHTVASNDAMAQHTRNDAASVGARADCGAATMADAIVAVETVQDSARRMDDIVETIDSLAFQTNLLALNAAVEAARAGESGRGFAVVAGEVRSLALRSSSAAAEIRSLIQLSRQQVRNSVEQIRSAGAQLDGIVGGIHDIAGSIDRIGASSAAQTAALGDLRASTDQLDEITRHNAALAGQVTEQAEQLHKRAGSLALAVARFRLPTLR